MAKGVGDSGNVCGDDDLCGTGDLVTWKAWCIQANVQLENLWSVGLAGILKYLRRRYFL